MSMIFRRIAAIALVPFLGCASATAGEYFDGQFFNHFTLNDANKIPLFDSGDIDFIAGEDSVFLILDSFVTSSLGGATYGRKAAYGEAKCRNETGRNSSGDIDYRKYEVCLSVVRKGRNGFIATLRTTSDAHFIGKNVSTFGIVTVVVSVKRSGKSCTMSVTKADGQHTNNHGGRIDKFKAINWELDKKMLCHVSDDPAFK